MEAKSVFLQDLGGEILPQRDRCLLYLTGTKSFIGKNTDVEEKVKNKKGDSRAVLSGLLFLVFCCEVSCHYLETS